MSRARRSCAPGIATLLFTVLVATSACSTGEQASTFTADSSAVAGPLRADPPPAAATTADTSLTTFWTQFRDAIAAPDTAAVLALTDRTFSTRGEMDDDPWVFRDSAAVVAILDSLLTTDPGLGRESTMRALVLATDTASLGRQVAGGELRVGSFVFAVREGRWRFSKAYLP